MTTEHSKPVESGEQPDSIAVNLMRLAGLEKDKARECENIIRAMLAANDKTLEHEYRKGFIDGQIDMRDRVADDKVGGEDKPFLFVYFDPTVGTHGAHKVAETNPPPADAFPVYTRPPPQAAQPAERVALTLLLGYVHRLEGHTVLPAGTEIIVNNDDRRFNPMKDKPVYTIEAAHGITAKDQS